jgi:hypothetical protein
VAFVRNGQIVDREALQEIIRMFEAVKVALLDLDTRLQVLENDR